VCSLTDLTELNSTLKPYQLPIANYQLPITNYQYFFNTFTFIKEKFL